MLKKGLTVVVVLLVVALTHPASAQHVLSMTPVRTPTGAQQPAMEAASGCKADADCGGDPTKRKCDTARSVCASVCTAATEAATCSVDEVCDSKTNLCRPETADDRYSPSLANMVFSGDVVTNPQDVKAGAYITPAFNADFKGFAYGEPKTSTISGIYNFHIAIQSPATSPQNASDTVQRVLLLGGDGNISGGLSTGAIARDHKRGILLVGNGAVAWTTTKVDDGSGSVPSTDTFAFGSASGAVTAWFGPAYFGVRGAYYHLLQSPKSNVARNDLNTRFALTALAAFHVTGGVYFQVRGQMVTSDLATNAAGVSDQTPVTAEARIVTSFTPF